MIYEKDVVPILLRLADLNRARAVSLLALFGVDTGRRLKPEQYADFVAQAETEIAKLKNDSWKREGDSVIVTLRDTLAMAALQGPVRSFHFGPEPKGGVPAEEWARRAYLIADAMLVERKK